jgi:hypothetical protein
VRRIADRAPLGAARRRFGIVGDVRPASAFRFAVGSTDVRRAAWRGIRAVAAGRPQRACDANPRANDAVVLRLDRPVRAFGAIRLATSGEVRYGDAGDAVATSRGARRNAGTPVTKLRDAALAISDIRASANRLADLGVPFDAGVCACTGGPRVESCQDDRGGPPMANQGTRRVVAVGPVSYGPWCARHGRPATFFRPSARFTTPSASPRRRPSTRLGWRRKRV